MAVVKTDGARALAGFLEARGYTQASAAESLGVSDPTIHDWLLATKRPRAHHRQAIEVWTGGEVTVGMWDSREERDAVGRVKAHDEEATGTED